MVYTKFCIRHLCFFFAICTLALIHFLPVSAIADAEKKSVLFINSYHNGYHWSDGLLEGVRSVLNASRFKIDLQIEYMDAKKFKYETISKNLHALYLEKFKNEQFDIVIVSDNDALNFVNEYRDELFADIPVVFCGINDLQPSDIRGGKTTGVVELFDLIATLRVAKKLHPKRDHLIILIDESTAGNAIRHQVERITEKENLGLDIEYWIQLSLEEAQKRVRLLPDNSFIFIAPYYQTINGRFYTSEEVSESIYRHSSVPIYTAWEFMVGYGAVGGKVLSSQEHGRTAGNMALEILSGKNIGDIPVINEPGGVYLFDHKVMENLKIDQKLLPENKSIINAPETIYSVSIEIFWTIMISFVLLLLAMVSMLGAMMERRKVERKIIDQLAFQETLMDTIPQLVSWKDTEGKYLGANQAFMDFFGIKKTEDVVGKSTNEIVGDKPYSDWSVTTDATTVLNKKAFRKERKQVRKGDNSDAWIEVNKVPLIGQGDRVVGVLTTAENVTKEQSLEKQLLQSQKMEALGTLAGGISHDFNNILTSIINSTELAIGDLTPGSQTEADLERVLKASRRGGRLIQQILSFSRPSREGFRPTDMGSIAQEVIHLLDASMPANILISMSIDAEQKFIVHADPTQVHQAILNLCTNAYHALRQTGGKISIELSKDQPDKTKPLLIPIDQGEFIQITISDNGPGIPADIIDKIFDPFFSTKSKPEGTGLGLAVVHGIVKNHRGTIQLESTAESGSTFRIFLPVSTRDKENPSCRWEKSIDIQAHILFVEDDDDQLLTTPRLLKGMGFSVTPIKDPVEAAQRCTSGNENFDLIITDFDMPALSGADLAKQVPHLPVILISGREDAHLAAKGVQNVQQVIIKPYDKQDLLKAIKNVLQKEIQYA